MKREDLFLAIGEVEEARLARSGAVNPSDVAYLEETEMGKFEKRRKGGIFRGVLIAAVIVSMLSVTAFAAAGYFLYDNPSELLQGIFGDATGFDHSDGSVRPDPWGGEEGIVVEPSFDRVPANEGVVEEEIAPFVSPVGSSVSWNGYKLTVDAFLYDRTTRCGFVTYLLENPEGVSGYSLQTNGEIYYYGARDFVYLNTYACPYIIQEKTTDTCLAAVCYFKWEGTDGEALQIGFAEASNYTNEEIAAIRAQLTEQLKQQMTEEEMLEACKKWWGEALYDEVMKEVGSEEMLAVCCEHLVEEELERRLDEEVCKEVISVSLTEVEALNCLELAEGGITVNPISLRIDTTGLGLTHTDRNGQVHTDTHKVESVIIRYRDGSEYTVAEGYTLNYAFALNELPEDNVATEVFVPAEEDPMGEGYFYVENSREYCIHTYMFNRVIDIETVASIIINGTEFSVE